MVLPQMLPPLGPAPQPALPLSPPLGALPPMGGPPDGMLPPMGRLPGMMPQMGMMGGIPQPPQMSQLSPMALQTPLNPQAMLIELLLSNPDLLGALPGQAELPRERDFWQEPPKPSESDMMTKARQDQGFLAALNRRFDDNLARINMKSTGVFPDHDEDAERRWQSSELADEDRMIMSIVGTIPPMFESPMRMPSDEDESQAKEDFLTYLHEEHRRQHARAGYGNLDMEMTKTVTRYGRICTRNVCRFEAKKGKGPFIMEMIDPSIIYPTFEGERGMTYATLIYWMQLGKFIGWHDRDGSIAQKLLGTKNPGTNSAYQKTDMVEIVEYWDCQHFGLFAAGTMVKSGDHDYGEPPFVYTVAPFGDPGYTRTPMQQRNVYTNGSSFSSAEVDFAERGLSYFAGRFEVHAQLEAILGKFATMVDKWGDEEVIIEQDDTVYNKGLPDVKRQKGARIVIRREHESIGAPITSPMPPTAQALMAQASQDNSRGALGPAEYGLTPSAQQSGYAIAGLSEKGKQKLAPIIYAMQDHHRATGEQRLRFYRDWGHLLGEPGNLGTLTIPRAMPSTVGSDQWWKLTPDMIDRTGWQVECRLVDTPDVQTLGAMANALGIIGKQGLITKRDAIKLLGLPGSRNPEQTIRDVEIEQLNDMPERKLARLLEYVSSPPPDGLGDMKMADFISSLIVKGKMAEQQGGGGPGGPGGPGGMQGQSNPMQGQRVGVQGGRVPAGLPANAGGPQPPPPPLGAMGPPTER